MSSEANKERQRAIDLVKPHGWYEASTNPKTGYTKMYCSCPEKHMMWLPKTPSNPNTYRNKAQRMIAMCSTEEAS